MGRKRKSVMSQQEAAIAVRVFDSASIPGGGPEYRNTREPILMKLNAIATGELIVVEPPKPKPKKEKGNEGRKDENPDE